MRFFDVYQYAGPVLLLPLGFWLWSERYGRDLRLVTLAMSVPIVFAYVIPGIGTNYLRLWEFDTRFRLGRFRPHHGFVFGSATSVLAWLAIDYPPRSYDTAEFLRSALVLGSVLAFWNWLYDCYAIKAGFIRVYTAPFARGESAETIATDYAPVLFGTFGACYGVCLRWFERTLAYDPSAEPLWLLAVVSHGACLACPVAAYSAISFARRGDFGLRSYQGVEHEQ
jgi:hypothetical protein